MTKQPIKKHENKYIHIRKDIFKYPIIVITAILMLVHAIITAFLIPAYLQSNNVTWWFIMPYWIINIIVVGAGLWKIGEAFD